jgi:DNA-binding beta-propeller fold protein YncE
MDVMQATPRDPRRSKRNAMRTAASTYVSRSWGAFVLGGCALVSGCTASAEDVRPPQDQLFFPSGLAVYPKGNVLFVANANSELRYDSGAISVIDLEAVQAKLDRWHLIPPLASCTTLEKPDVGDCEADPDHRETMTCEAAPFLKKGAGVRIGNFATDIAMQDFGTKVRLIVPTRGDPSIAWADYADDRLSCTSGAAGFALCDDAHRLSTVQNDPDSPPIPDEPFGVFADPGPRGADGGYSHGFAMVTHLTNSAVTLIDSPANGNAQIADVVINLFAPDPTTGLRGATGIAGRTQGADGTIVYVGSRTEDRIQTFTVGRPANDAPPYLLPSNFFFLDAVGTNPGVGGSSDTRGMQFSPTGDRMYAVNRRPPSLSIFDTSIGPDGVPRNVPSGASDICRQASTLTVFDAGAGERAYVTCFQDGEIYVVDPRGQSQVEDIITVGRGPYSVAAASYQATYPSLDPKCQTTTTRSLLFVSNVLEDTIAVIDVTPTSANRNRVVLRIGIPRAP